MKLGATDAKWGVLYMNMGATDRLYTKMKNVYAKEGFSTRIKKSITKSQKNITENRLRNNPKTLNSTIIK
jgi:hypothetical protein